jgi:hypothetical protein
MRFGLAQHLQRRPPELGQLVEEKNPVVGQDDLPRPGDGPPADHRHVADRVVWAPEGPLREKAPVGPQQAGDAVHLRGLQSFLEGGFRKDRGEPAREHRLARPGRPDQQHVVPAAGGDLERPLRVLLPPDILQVQARHPPCLAVRKPARRLRIEIALPIQELDDLLQVAHGMDRDAFRDRGLTRVLPGDEEPVESGPARRDGRRKRPGRALHPRLQAQLTEQQVAGEPVRLDASPRGEDADGNREVETRSLLAKIGRRQVDGHTAHREGIAGVLDCGPHAIAALLHGAARQPDDAELRESRGHVDLHVHDQGIDTED